MHNFAFWFFLREFVINPVYSITQPRMNFSKRDDYSKSLTLLNAVPPLFNSIIADFWCYTRRMCCGDAVRQKRMECWAVGRWWWPNGAYMDICNWFVHRPIAIQQQANSFWCFRWHNIGAAFYEIPLAIWWTVAATHATIIQSHFDGCKFGNADFSSTKSTQNRSTSIWQHHKLNHYFC